MITIIGPEDPRGGAERGSLSGPVQVNHAFQEAAAASIDGSYYMLQ